MEKLRAHRVGVDGASEQALESGIVLRGMHRRFVQRPRTQRLAHVLAELCGGASNLLDVGAGNGSLGRQVAQLLGGARVCGLDVRVQPEAVIDVRSFDGERLPFDDQSFDCVLLSDVLHHAEAPRQLLGEAMRVAGKAVVIKDHFAFGAGSRALLWLLDWGGNAPYGTPVTGGYLSPAAWHAALGELGAHMVELRWPLQIHAPALSLLTRSEVQFAARVERTR